MAKAKKSRKRTAKKAPAVRIRRAAPAAKKATKKMAAPKKTPKTTVSKSTVSKTTVSKTTVPNTTAHKSATSMTAPPTPSVLSFGAGLETIVKNSSLLSERVAELTKEVSFSVATKTIGGKQIQQQMGLLTAGNLHEFNPAPDAKQDAIDKLVAEGCKVIRNGRFAVTMSGPASVVEKLIGGKLVVQARARRSPLRATQMFATSFEPPLAHDLFVSPAASLSVGTTASDNVDHLVFIPPPVYFAPPSPNAPPGGFHRVDEASIRSILNVPAGFDGDGVRVAMVGTGFFPHPYYSQRGLKFRAVPTASAPNPQVDDYGHGTAIAYNVFATAPKVELLGFQQTDPPQDALEDAADANVDVITCSWGWDREQLFPLVQASLLSIINEGKIVLFAAGNGQYAWPGSEPDVISVGGVYSNAARALEASDYASGYMSGMFPGRRTPDVCGLCGQRPKAIYIMMPTQPANTMDQEFSGASFPNGDETTANDGWVGASGTSSATPQIAGIVALMVQKARANGTALTAASVKAALEQSCVPVTEGRNAMGFPAVGQPNTAVGFGLVDATAAIARI